MIYLTQTEHKPETNLRQTEDKLETQTDTNLRQFMRKGATIYA